MNLSLIKSIAGVPVYTVDGEPNSFIYKAGLMINADGAPTAYGPAGTEPLDYLGNAGKPGNWWGIATDSKGQPYLQAAYHPAPGYYVSTTAHINPAFPQENPDRYMDSTMIPFFVLPGDNSFGAKLGDVGLLYNTQTQDNMFCIYADVGPKDKIGEASISAAKCLKVNPDPKTGGTSSKIIVTLVFPGSVGKWQPQETWFASANSLFTKWGGLTKLKSLIPQLG